jgi:hypothetical protein
MILVDTSVLIDFLKGTKNSKTEVLDQIIENQVPFGINKYIYLEILQGAKTEKEFNLLKNYFETIQIYDLLYETESFEKAAFLKFICKSKGITVRSTIDLLIAETAIENNLFLLHNDNDFDGLASVIPELKILSRHEFL